MAFLNPVQVLEQSHVGEGMRIADLGAGSGLWSIAAAKIVGAGGHVVAVEIQKELVAKIAGQAQSERVQIEVLWGDLEKSGGTKIADASIDVVLAVNVLFQVQKKEVFIQEITRILRKGGTVLCIDWSESFGGLGPHSSHIVPQFAAEQLFLDGGFVLEKNISVGDHHYGMVFRKK
jgi:ubiquinone/menaquinone biosynthesis C-methylase UbiE